VSDESTLIHDARLVDAGKTWEGAWLLVERGRIRDRGQGRDLPPADRRHDARGASIVPGFVDIHCHGGGGHSAEGAADDVRAMARFHRGHGTTALVVSLATAPLPRLRERIERITEVVGTEGVLGIHLEGPFLSTAHRGAHSAALLLPPTPRVIAELLGAAHGSIRQITLAPENASDEVLDLLLEEGVRVAVGHTDADFAQASHAFSRGASILTHAFNGMPGIHHRAPGPVVAACDSADVVLELIADGVHVHPAVIALLFRLAPGRIALVTDAIAAAGAPDGDYPLGDDVARVCAGVARVGDSLAGSTLTMDRAVRVCVAAGVPVAEAIRAATRTPADAIGARDRGGLRPGDVADLVELDDRLEVRRVWIDGVPQ